MHHDSPFRVVVAGAGVAGLEAVLALREYAEERVELDVLAPEDEFTYRPLAVAEPFHAGTVVRFSLRELLEPVGARHRRDTLAAVDPSERALTTGAGEVVGFDALVVACGGTPREAVSGALTFRGTEDRPAFTALLADLEAGRIRSIAFAVPGGPCWQLPLYELALLTAAHAEGRGLSGVELCLVTPEHAPLAVFGDRASEAVRALLAERGVKLLTEAHPVSAGGGVLRTTGGGAVAADRVVSLARIAGPSIRGLPSDPDGFLPTGEHGAVRGRRGIYAAGDACAFPIKQGGIAAQQAEQVAQAVAARAGAHVAHEPFRPVLRGLLLTGGAPRYLRAEVASGRGATSTAALEPLWWPPAKVAGRRLAPYLAELAGHEPPEGPPSGLPVDVPLSTIEHT